MVTLCHVRVFIHSATQSPRCFFFVDDLLPRNRLVDLCEPFKKATNNLGILLRFTSRLLFMLGIARVLRYAHSVGQQFHGIRNSVAICQSYYFCNSFSDISIPLFTIMN